MLMRSICLCAAVVVTVLLLHAPALSQAPAGGGYGVSSDRDTAGGDKDDAKDMGEDKKNRQDMTADQQAEDKSDREMTRNIRKAIVDDESLSLYADNIKIITRGGMVTLKGKVKTQEEKDKIMEKAVGIAGKDKVTDHMNIKEQK